MTIFKFTRKSSGDAPNVCPFCQGNLDEILGEVLTGQTEGITGTVNVMVYSCPHCRRLLGIGSY